MATTYTKHHLKDLKGRVIYTWTSWPSWDWIQEEVAHWADCLSDEVGNIETPGGEFMTVDGIPVAYLEKEQVVIPGPEARVIPITVNGNVIHAEFMTAAE